MPSDEILNIKEVSCYLKIPVSTIYKLIQEGKIPAVKLGKHWRFMKKDIECLFVQAHSAHDRSRSEDSKENSESGGVNRVGAATEKDG